MRKHTFSYYYILTFSDADRAKNFFAHLSQDGNPPVDFVALWGTWLSTDYKNAKRFFAGWICKDHRASGAVGQWEYRQRSSSFEQGSVADASPDSPLGVGLKVDSIIDERFRGA